MCSRRRELKTITRGAIDWSSVSEHLVARHLPGRGCDKRRPLVVTVPKPRVFKIMWEFPEVHFHRTCECNELVALNNRFLSPAKKFNYRAGQQLTRLVDTLCSELSRFAMEPLSRQTFAESSLVPSKRKLYIKAAENLSLHGWRDEYATISMFQKVEPVHGESKDPRAIQGRTPEWTVELGRFIKVIEKFLTNLDWSTVFPWAPPGRMWAKGLNHLQRAKLLRAKADRFVDPVFIDIDASKFDMSVEKQWLLLCHRIYVALIKGDVKTLKKLLVHQLRNYGVSRHGIRYKRDSGRSSGDPDTGCGNSLINVTGHVAFFELLEVKWDFLCDGDDGLLILERVDLHVMESYTSFWEAVGFDMKVGDIVDQFELISFCQTRPVEVMPGKWIMCRDPVRVVQRSLYTHTMRREVEIERLMWSVGTCELSIHSGIPILQEYALWCIRNGRKPSDRQHIEFVQTQHQYWTLPNSGQQKPVSATARCSFERAFGIPPNEQLLIERQLRLDNFTLSEPPVEVFPARDTGAGPVKFERDWQFYKRVVN